MTKWVLARPGTWDYPTMGFSAVDGAILDGTLFTPAVTVAPDAYWSVYGGASAETGVTRYGALTAASTANEPTEGAALVYNTTTNTYEPTSASLSVTYGAVDHLAAPADIARSLPVFTRVGSTPVIVAASSALASVYWPWAMKVSGLIGSPLAAYYLWTSSDHSAGAGGIELWKAASPEGPWTSHGVVYTDTTSGSQTETPSVIWVPATSLFHMYYQQAGASGSVDQSTFLATSPDGVAWTRVGKAIDVLNSTDQPGDGHTGYANPFLIGEQWFAYHLKGGGDYAHFGLATSLDGITWNLDPRALGYGAEWYALTGNRNIQWNHCTVIAWRGRRLLVGLLSNFISGGAAADRRLFVAPISDDLRRIIGPPKIFLTPTGWETDNYRACSVLHEGGYLYLYYQTDGNIGVAKAAI